VSQEGLNCCVEDDSKKLEAEADRQSTWRLKLVAACLAEEGSVEHLETDDGRYQKQPPHNFGEET
jgi:hypothetical protein